MKRTMSLELTEEVWTALYQVLNYHWLDEYRHYCGCKRAERAGHIFESLRAVRNWLEGAERKLHEAPFVDWP